MNKSEMADIQLQKRAFFVERLTSHGWSVEGWEYLFENDAELTPEAQAEYENPNMSLRLSYFLKPEYILLECTENSGSLLPPVHYYPKRNIFEILDTIIDTQDTLSTSSYPNLIKRIIPLCRMTVLETPEGLVELSL
jgi:hypothetical protein